MPTTRTLRCALPRLMARPSSQRPILISLTVSSACHRSVKADKLNMSCDIWKKRLSDLLWNSLWIRVISLGLVPALKAWSHFKALLPLTQKVEVLRCLRPVAVCVRTYLNRVGKPQQGCWWHSANEGKFKSPSSPPSLPYFMIGSIGIAVPVGKRTEGHVSMKKKDIFSLAWTSLNTSYRLLGRG